MIGSFTDEFKSNAARISAIVAIAVLTLVVISMFVSLLDRV